MTSKAAPLALALLLAGSLSATTPPLEEEAHAREMQEAPRVTVTATGNFAPGGTVWIKVTPLRPGLRVLLRLPAGLEAVAETSGNLGRPGETAFFEARVTGPVLPGTPVFVSAYEDGALADSARQPIYVGRHEGGAGEAGEYFLLWLQDGTGGQPWPLPRVAGGYPERLLKQLPREPEPRLRELLRVGVILLQDGRTTAARRVLSRAWRLEEARLQRTGAGVTRLDHAVTVASAMALVREGRQQAALTLLGRLLARAEKDDPLRRYALFMAGRLLLEAGQEERAAVRLREAVRLNPSFHAARSLLAP